jgi:hypothetical protein
MSKPGSGRIGTEHPSEAARALGSSGVRRLRYSPHEGRGQEHLVAPFWIASYAGRDVTDINGFVRLSQRNPQREAGLARIRQRVKAGKLKLAWMSEEEKAAYRLREPPETRATVAPVYNPDE